MIKITFFANVDYANVLTEYSNVINKYSDKYSSKVICLSPHRFNYGLPHDYNINIDNNKFNDIKRWVDDSKHIIFGEEMSFGNYTTYETFRRKFSIDERGKKISVWHPGSNYRDSAKKFNNHPFNRNLHRKIYSLDLYRLSNKEENDVVLLPFKSFDGDVDGYRNKFYSKLHSGKRIISHYPSNPLRKGTNIINKIISEIIAVNDVYKYDYDTSKPNKEIVYRKSKSLLYVDQINDAESFGVAAIESMIESNIVFCTINKSKEGLLRAGIPEEKIPIINISKDYNTLKKIMFDFLKSDRNIEDMLDRNINYLMEFHYGPNVMKYLEDKILNDE